jgi:predicted dehydrogenase
MTRTINWGFWGAGEVARQVAADLALTRGGVLHAVGSRTARSATALAAAHGVSRAVTDLGELLADAAIDVIYIATPHMLHAQDAIRCLASGKAVLCEKPLAVDEKQARQIATAARAAGRFCMEAMWSRFIPAVAQALQLARSGAIGPIVSLHGEFSDPMAFDPTSRFFAPELGGGALLDRGVYLISLAQALLGAPVAVQSMVRRAPTGVDAHTAFQLRFDGGAVAQFTASLSEVGNNAFMIAGERGRITLHDPFLCAHRFSVERRGPRGLPTGPAPGLAARLKRSLRAAGLQRRVDALRLGRKLLASTALPFRGNGYQFQLDEVMQCLREGRIESTVMPLADSIAVARAMDQVREAASAT